MGDEDFASAAARHWDNAQFLADASRWQEAAYLAGYVVECSLKTLLKLTMPAIVEDPKKLGHDLVALTGETLEMAVLLNPASRRYPITSLTQEMAGAGQWSEQHRYLKTGCFTDAEFQHIVNQAQQIAQSALIELVLDGVIEDIPQ